jgi:flagellar protein FliO/FliZ
MWFYSTLLALLICTQHRSACAGDDDNPPNGSSTVSPAAFQSPVASGQPLANTAAAIDMTSTRAISHTTTAAGAPETTVPSKTTPLAPAGLRDRSTARVAPSSATAAGTWKNSTSQSVVTVLGSLGVVLGLFFVTMWLFRGGASKAGQILPVEVVEPLGRTAVAKGQQLQLIRFGRKLVLVSHSSAAGIETISEITDPVEVDRIAGLCQGKSPLSSTRAFQSVLDGFSGRDISVRHGDENRRTRSWTREAVGGRGRSREDDDA